MEIRRFVDEYDAVAGAWAVSAMRVRERDDATGGVTWRWIGLDQQGAVVAVLELMRRPDSRMFIDRRRSPGLEALVDHAQRELSLDLFAMSHDAQDTACLEALGFVTDVEEEGFEIGFDAALTALDRARVPDGIEVVSADRVAADDLFALDNRLRSDVPGLDGWEGRRDWFDSELAQSPPFVAEAYPVAVSVATGQLVGLCRVWRNEEGPRLGLVAVVPEWRRTGLGPALAKHALTVAQRWGWSTFTAETAVTNRAIHPRLVRIGAASDGRFRRMVRAVDR